MAKANKNIDIKLNKELSRLVGVGIVPPKARKIDFTNLTNEDKLYLVKHNHAEKITPKKADTSEK